MEDELIGKYVKGDITLDQLNEEVNKLPQEEQDKFNDKLKTPEVQKQIKEKSSEALRELQGLRDAKKHVQKDTVDFAANLRKENLDKASKRFFAEKKIPAEEQQSYLDALEASHASAVGEDVLFAGLKSVYAGRNADKLLKAEEELETMKQNGEEFNEDNAGAAGGSGDGGGTPDKRDASVLRYMKDAERAGMPFDSYESALRVYTQGNKRVIK